MPRIGFESWTAATAVIDGREHTVFGGCNYLGLAHHPAVHQAITAGLARWGATVTASRETTGNTAAHEAMEREIAAFLDRPAAILTTEGYTANIALGQGLAGLFTSAVVDEKSHSSVIFGMGAPGLRTATYRHLDAADALRVLRSEVARGERPVLMTDGVFAAGGGVAPAAQLLNGLPDSALLILDDCHGFTVLGPGGRGVAHHFGCHHDPRLVITTTFGKGLGAYGGAVTGPKPLIDRIREKSLIYRGTTPCPPAMVEGAREALRVVAREPQRLARLRENVRLLRATLADAVGWSPVQPAQATRGADGSDALIPILTFHFAPVAAMQQVQHALSAAGIFIPLIDYPNGPTPWFFRPTVTAEHTAEQIHSMGRALARTLADAGISPALTAR
jgi:7-keto-8-aminopelargonate synthetase-like enzyme